MAWNDGGLQGSALKNKFSREGLAVSTTTPNLVTNTGTVATAKNTIGNYLNPQGISNSYAQGYSDNGSTMGAPVQLNYEQLDAINNPTLGSEAVNAPGLAESLGGMKGMAQGLGALGQLGNAYVGYKNYDLAKKQFEFENNLARANYANSATAYNTNLQNSADVGLALAGSSMTPEQKAAYQTQIAGNKVNTRL